MFSRKMKSKKDKNKIGRIGLCLLFLVLIAAGVYFFTSMSGLQSADRKTDDLTLVNFTIGNKHFEIPRAYISDRSARDGGIRDSVNLDALLPDLKPYSIENKKEFEKLGHGNKVGFLLEYSLHRLERKQVFDRLHPEDAIKKARKDDLGFYVYQAPAIEKTTGEDIYFRYLTDGTFFYLTCKRSETVVSPSCMGSAPLGNGFYITYHYSHDHLRDWQRIDKSLRNLIRQFEVPASVNTTK
jgi:hypothetical protein